MSADTEDVRCSGGPCDGMIYDVPRRAKALFATLDVGWRDKPWSQEAVEIEPLPHHKSGRRFLYRIERRNGRGAVAVYIGEDHTAFGTEEAND